MKNELSEIARECATKMIIDNGNVTVCRTNSGKEYVVSNAQAIQQAINDSLINKDLEIEKWKSNYFDMEKQASDAYKKGVFKAISIAREYNNSTEHKYDIGDCILAKMNLIKKEQIREVNNALKILKNRYVKGSSEREESIRKERENILIKEKVGKYIENMKVLLDISTSESPENAISDLYCKLVKCSKCNGTDLNGEPNGYGCNEMETFTETVISALDVHKYDDCISLIESLSKQKCQECIDKDIEINHLKDKIVEISRISCGEDQVACNDSEGMTVIYNITKQILSDKE